MFPSLPELTITDSAPVPLIDTALLFTPSPTTNSYAQRSGYWLKVITDGALYFGGDDVEASIAVASSMAAGTYEFTLRDAEVPYAIAPSGQTVHVQRFASGLKSESESTGGGFDDGGYG